MLAAGRGDEVAELEARHRYGQRRPGELGRTAHCRRHGLPGRRRCLPCPPSPEGPEEEDSGDSDRRRDICSERERPGWGINDAVGEPGGQGETKSPAQAATMHRASLGTSLSSRCEGDVPSVLAGM